MSESRLMAAAMEAAESGALFLTDETLAAVTAAIEANDLQAVWRLIPGIARLPLDEYQTLRRDLEKTFGRDLRPGEFNREVSRERKRIECGITYHMGDTRLAPKIQGAADTKGLRLTEYGNAERLVRLFGQNLRFDFSSGKWLHWDGVRWVPDASAEVIRLAKLTVRNLYREAGGTVDPEERKAIASWAMRSEKAAQINAMIRLAESESGIPVLAEDLDANHWLLNVRNGTVDLKTGELKPHRRDDRITKLAPVEYDPAARCPRWQRFLAEVFEPHPDLPEFIQRAVGYSLTGETREECLFLLHGTGRNGKGVLIKTIAAAIGDYAGTSDFSTFTAKRDDRGPSDDIANMKGRRFISAQESREGAALAESVVKWLTGGDMVRARRLFENSYEFLPTWKIWLATNHKPTIRGVDPGIWSRLKLIPFSVSFQGREDRTLKTALLDELPGILNWAIEGALRWQEEGLAFPDSILDATREYRNESDQAGRFVEECCVRGEYVQVRARSLYQTYRKWAEGAGEGTLSETEFGRRMAERGIPKKREERGNVYVGIGLTSQSEAL